MDDGQKPEFREHRSRTRPLLGAPRREKVREWHERLRDPSLTALLIIQIVAIFIAAPAAAIGVPLPRVASLSLVLGVVSLVVIVSRGRKTIFIGLVCMVTSITGVVLREHRPGLPTHILSGLGIVLALCVLTWVISTAVFGPGRVTGHRIRGAIVLYLNIGITFAALFRLVDEISPNSFTGLPPIGTGAHFESALIYFSFTTLTSIGFGDVVPVHPFARSLANLEGIVGQLYPATLLARIVTLHLESGRR